jgi:hypothetical protein
MMGHLNGLVDEMMLNHFTPLGVTEDGRSIWPITGADNDDDADDAGSDDADDDAEDDADDQDDDSEDDDKKDKSKKDKPKDKKDTEDDDDDDAGFWHSRADRFKARMEAADRRATAAERENKRLKVGSADSLDEQGKQDLKDTVVRLNKAEESLTSMRLANAILLDTTYQWEDPELVLSALAKDDTVEIDEHGKVVGVKQALRSLAKSKPFLIKKAVVKVDPKGDDDDDDDDDDGKSEPKRSSGNPSNGRRSKSAVADKKTLMSKYPMLGRR